MANAYAGIPCRNTIAKRRAQHMQRRAASALTSMTSKDSPFSAASFAASTAAFTYNTGAGDRTYARTHARKEGSLLQVLVHVGSRENHCDGHEIIFCHAYLRKERRPAVSLCRKSTVEKKKTFGDTHAIFSDPSDSTTPEGVIGLTPSRLELACFLLPLPLSKRSHGFATDILEGT